MSNKIVFRSSISFFLILLFSLPISGCDSDNNIQDDNQSHFQFNRQDYQWNEEVINAALKTRLIRWENDPNVNTEYTTYGVLHSGKALNYLALVAFHDQSNRYPKAAAKVVEQLRYVISGGKEPTCRGTIAGWADNSLAQSIALAKYTGSIWGNLTRNEKEKLDLLMKSLAIAGNYCHNSRNHIHKGLYQSFEWRKTWNPNHQEGYVGVMIAAWVYFGGTDAVNSIFDDFIFKDYINQFESYGFNNIKSCWQATGKELMESGGTDSGGGTTDGAARHLG